MTLAGEMARDAGLETGWIELAGAVSSTRCYRARPKEPVPVPGLIVLHEAFGMEDPNPSPEVASELCAELERLGQSVQLKVFEGARHAILRACHPTYREVPALELGAGLDQFFDRWLG
ncbi:MAG TPA: hypothetical protein VND96_16765 [Candidatus Micrarchaeaceae archaeon]|nr:hypothetical protein [Candidatus Micrarchaeaceae archaeon]